MCNKKGLLITTDRIDTSERQVAGSQLRAVQPYCHVSHDVAILGTTVKEASISVAAAKEFFMRGNRAIRNLKKGQQVIWYHDIHLENRTSGGAKEEMALFLFTDAGFGSLKDGNPPKVV